MMPLGMSRPGSSHSSAHVETASNPMYAKKMTAAPAPTPAKPFGAKGCQFSVRTKRVQARTKKARTTSLTPTITVLTRADSLTPQTRTIVTAATMPIARALKTMGTPRTCGALASRSGEADAVR